MNEDEIWEKFYRGYYNKSYIVPSTDGIEATSDDWLDTILYIRGLYASNKPL